jgi:hypothetical protein
MLTLLLLLALLFVPASNAHAQSPGGDVIRIGENYTLKSEETLDGSLVVIGGNATIEKGAIVNGDIVVIGGNLVADGESKGSVVIIGGNATISSKASGDVVTIGGQTTLTKTAVVKGNVVTFGGHLTQEEGSEVAGDVINNAPPINIPDVPGVPEVPGVPNSPEPPNFNLNVNPVWELMNVIGRALAIAAIAMLLTLFLQPQMERVSDAVMKQPLLAGSFGLLTVVLAPLAIIIMAVTIILIPVAFIVALILPLAWLFGMIAIGQEVGERFTKAINQVWSPVLSNGFGAFLLVLVVGFIGMVPCFGWLLSFLVTLVAFGGVVMTWFGTRNAPGKPAAPAAPVAMEAPLPPAS